MIVREWDPRTASADEVESLLVTVNAALAADLPEDPLWRNVCLREYLGETMPNERRICWVADDPAGGLVGYASILLLGDIGVVDVWVRPAARRQGVGRRLLEVLARRAHAEGFSSIGVEVICGTPAVEFYEAHGFRCAYVETRSVLDLSTVDWLALGEMARGIAAGYRVEFCPGGPPEELVDAYARAKAEVRDIDDDGDLELRPSSYDPQRLRDSLDTLSRRGMKPYIVLAIHEASGDVAGLTEVVVPAQHPTRADQYDTLVVPAHRGYGVARAIKARMLFELRRAETGLVDVQTWNAQVNEPLLKVNAELGFQPDREWREYEADVTELVHLINGRNSRTGPRADRREEDQ